MKANKKFAEEEIRQGHYTTDVVKKTINHKCLFCGKKIEPFELFFRNRVGRKVWMGCDECFTKIKNW